MRSRASDLIDEMIADGSPAEYVSGAGVPAARPRSCSASSAFHPRTTRWSRPGASTGVRSRGASRRPPSRSRSHAACSTTGATAVRSSPSARASAPTTSRPSCSTRTTPIRTRRTEAASATARSSRSCTASRSPGTIRSLPCSATRCVCLLPRRDQWDALCADPSLVANAVEETLRFESSQVSWRRVTTQPTTLGGVDLPAGTRSS